MIINLYSIFDSKALAFGPPFPAATHGLAVRMFGDLVGDSNTTVGRHPSDFRLYCVATFDDQKAVTVGVLPPEHIVDAIALVQHQQPLPLEVAAQ